MSNPLPLYEARLLQYEVSAFAKIAVSNAVWLAGEWVALGKPSPAQFQPDVGFMLEPRCREEALVVLETLSEARRLKIFFQSFAWGPHEGGDHLFKRLVAHHSALFCEDLGSEWTRLLIKLRGYGSNALSYGSPEHKALPKPASSRLESKS